MCSSDLILCLVSSVVYASCSFQTDNVKNGIIKISYTGTSGKRAKVMIERSGTKYTYDINTSGKVETYPLQLGNGEYKITVLENTSGTSYKIVSSKKVTLNLSDNKVVYLNSIQNINWTTSDKAIQYAIQLTKNYSSLEDKAKVLYNHMVQNYSYDYSKLSTLPSTYLPNIDSTFADKKGICYDFSSLFAAMLRSQGVYAKLIKGYTPNANGYHAWNEVYDSSTKEWVIIDTTYDLQMYAYRKSTSMAKASKDYDVVYEY